MIRVTLAPRETLDRIPRESGDDPQSLFFSQLKFIVFPARAGMIRAGIAQPFRPSGIPRESGDDPF